MQSTKMEERSDNEPTGADNDINHEETVNPSTKPRENASLVWLYYQKLSPLSEKLARCVACKEIRSYKSSTSNLKMHIQLKHPELVEKDPGLAFKRTSTTPMEEYQHEQNNHSLELNKIENDEADTDSDYAPEQSSSTQSLELPKLRRNQTGAAWKYFTPLNPVSEKIAECKACFKRLSYKSTITNLKTHLFLVHTELVKDDPNFANFKIRRDRNPKKQRKRKQKWEYMEVVTDDDEMSNTNLSTQIWLQFNHDDEEPTCNHCREMVPRGLENMQYHLEKRHTGILDTITRKVLHAASEDENVDENEPFSEVVYLEDEADLEKFSHKLVKADKPKKKIRKERKISSSSDEAPLVQKPKTNKTPDELEAFLSYITVLLRQVPKESSQKLQLDIINLIMNATQQQKTLVIESVNLNNVSTSNILSTVVDNNVLLNQNETDTSNDNTILDNDVKVIRL